MGKLYSVFIPKYRDTHITSFEQATVSLWPLGREIARYLTKAGWTDNIVVSPGFLSAGEFRTIDFLDEFQSLLVAAQQGCKNGPINVYVLRGENGGWSVVRNSRAKNNRTFSSATGQPTILRLHEIDYANLSLGGALSYNFNGLEPDGKADKDHRKMLFFVNGDLTGLLHPSGLAASFDKLMAGLEVEAVAFGSSNFSYQTYFAPQFDKGEFDVLMFVNGAPYLNAIEEDLEGVVSQGNRRTASRYEGVVTSESRMLVPDDAHALLKGLFDDLLRHYLGIW